ncbi:MAG: hypothetical protein HYW07_15170 [Candidatus Latescibacteria bacterium]|nr:hypothetical protein [Candidatus Latescibacterota bacterium]
MGASRFQVLSQVQVQQFLDQGYTAVEGCFTEDFARPLREQACRRLGCDPDDPATWKQEIAYLDHHTRFRVKELSPRAWAAICEVVGGEERIEFSPTLIQPSPHFTSIESGNWSDAFIINFSYGAGQPWEPPSAITKGWHKDGAFFRHFLDSPDQGLLTVILWSEVRPRSGGTFIACDSVRHVARYLLEHPEGVSPDSFSPLIGQCRDFAELTGQPGDLILLHPFVLHTSSPNPSGRPRFITNPPIVLREPLVFDRPDPDDFSLVEQAILRGLGAERLAFAPTAPRQRIALSGPAAKKY